MKQFTHITAWTFVTTIVTYAAVQPDSGVIYQSPLACLGLGLIGLGLCMESRKHATLAVTATPCARPDHNT